MVEVRQPTVEVVMEVATVAATVTPLAAAASLPGGRRVWCMRLALLCWDPSKGYEQGL